MAITDKTVLISGATDGLGKGLAARAASEGARVLLHGRDQAKGEKVLAELKALTGNDRLAFYRADLARLDEVRHLAAAVLADHARLDVLINNAGIALFGDTPRQLTDDGQEVQFQVNYLAHFLLTQRLLPALKAGAPARIVSVSSGGQVPLDFSDVMMAQGYTPLRGYCQSKLAQVMFTVELAERLAGSGVTATALHPGTCMNTNMVIGGGITPITPVEEGVEATWRLATSAEMEGVTGVFFNQQVEVRAKDQAYDPAARRRLWDISLKLAGLDAG